MKKKRLGLVLTILSIITLVLGTTYAFYNFTILGNKTSILVTGNIYMNYFGSNKISMENMMPMSKSEALESRENEFNFQVIGKNTSDKDIYYGISLLEGEELEGKTRIKPENINVYLTSGDEVLLDAVRYTEFDGRNIWVDTIKAGTSSEVTKNYALKVWLDENILISDTEDYADYTVDEWNNSYVSLKVNVNGRLDEMNMPLSIETSDKFVENNKAYFIAKVSNYLDMSEAGIQLLASDMMKLEISGTNSDVLFSYKDEEGNEQVEATESLSLNYEFLTNKTVEVQVFVTPKNDANGNTDITVKLSKNGEQVYSLVKNMNVKGNNYCLNNGFNKLGDCMLVSEHLTDNVEIAKTQIANKGSVNLNDTAPTYTYTEEITPNVNNAYTATGYKFYFADSYEFNEATGTFKLKNSDGNIVITDALNDSYISTESKKYYTCGATNQGYLECSTIYEILGTCVEGTKYTITLANKHTYKVSSSIRSEVGLYKTTDDYGDTYFYRGDVENNNVYFGGYYWKIVRMNGDGSIRLIYNGTNKDATGNATSINGTTYQYNSRYTEPAYVGYMHGDNFKVQVSKETFYTNIEALTKYYFADDYEFDESTKMFKLAGNITTEGKTVSEMNNEDLLKTYPYTCKSTSPEGTCQFVIKVNSYINEKRVNAQYVSYSSTSLESASENLVDSDIKNILDIWYETNIIGKSDSEGNLLTNYIVDGSFCNERGFYSGDGFSLASTTYYNAYKRLEYDSNKSASLSCSNTNNKFSQTASRGNGKLEYPVALITADEVVLAGGKIKTKNLGYYLRTSGYYWTMTPVTFSEHNAYAFVYSILQSGEMVSWNQISLKYGVRPVLNIRSDVLISKGEGTIENPFELTY